MITGFAQTEREERSEQDGGCDFSYRDNVHICILAVCLFIRLKMCDEE